MRHAFFLFLLMGTAIVCPAQVSGLILDLDTRQPIPYASIWLDKQDKGTTAAADGSFLLVSPGTGVKNLLVTAAGYETSRVSTTTGNQVISLKPKPWGEKKTGTASRTGTRKQVVAAFKKSALKGNFYGNDGTPYVLARYYPYDSAYAQTPYLASITLYTWSKIPQATFQLRLFAAGTRGEPGEELLPAGLPGTAEKGQKLTTVDLSSYRLKMPDRGLFIGFEWLVTDSNKREYDYTRKGGKIKHKGISYEPDLGISREAGSERWMYIGGAWRSSADQKQDIQAKLQFKLTLTD